MLVEQLVDLLDSLCLKLSLGSNDGVGTTLEVFLGRASLDETALVNLLLSHFDSSTSLGLVGVVGLTLGLLLRVACLSSVTPDRLVLTRCLGG